MEKSKKRFGLVVIILIAGSTLLALLILLSRGLMLTDASNKDIVLWINEYAVSNEEYQFYQQLNRAESSSYFYSKYQVDISGNEDDWNQEYGGEIPREVLKKNTEEDLIYDYVLRSLGEKYGSTMPKNFAEFQGEFQQFNENRIAQINADQVVYGPEQYDFMEYYMYFYSDQKNKIIEAMSQVLLEQEEDKIEEYYLSLEPKEIVSDFKAEMVYYYTLDTLPKEEAKQVFEEAIKLVEAGISPEEQFGMGKETIYFNSSAISKEDMDSMVLADLIETKKEGEVWINETGQYNGILELKGVSRERIPEFEQNKQWAAGQYAYRSFEDGMDQLLADAKIRYEKN